MAKAQEDPEEHRATLVTLLTSLLACHHFSGLQYQQHFADIADAQQGHLVFTVTHTFLEIMVPRQNQCSDFPFTVRPRVYVSLCVPTHICTHPWWMGAFMYMYICRPDVKPRCSPGRFILCFWDKVAHQIWAWLASQHAPGILLSLSSVSAGITGIHMGARNWVLMLAQRTSSQPKHFPSPCSKNPTSDCSLAPRPSQ